MFFYIAPAVFTVSVTILRRFLVLLFGSGWSLAHLVEASNWRQTVVIAAAGRVQCSAWVLTTGLHTAAAAILAVAGPPNLSSGCRFAATQRVASL